MDGFVARRASKCARFKGDGRGSVDLVRITLRIRARLVRIATPGRRRGTRETRRETLELRHRAFRVARDCFASGRGAGGRREVWESVRSGRRGGKVRRNIRNGERGKIRANSRGREEGGQSAGNSRGAREAMFGENSARGREARKFFFKEREGGMKSENQFESDGGNLEKFKGRTKFGAAIKTIGGDRGTEFEKNSF